MSPWSLTIEREELLRIGDVLGSFAPSEIDGEGVWVRSVNGSRVWSCCTSGVLWEVVGAPVTERIAPRCLPGRLLWNARSFALLDGDVEVTIEIPDTEVAIAHCSVGRSIIDLPRETVVPQYPMYVTESATARLGVGSFLDLLQRASITVPGPDGAPIPTAYLLVRDDEVILSVDWSIRRGYRTTQFAPAATVGDGDRAIRIQPLIDLLQYVDAEGELAIVVPANPSIPLLIEGDGVRFAVDPVLDGASRYHGDLEQALHAASGGACRTVDKGEFTVDIGERTFHVELLDSNVETIVFTTRVCGGIEPTTELLTQINDTNAGLVSARLWFADGAVWARSELPVTAVDGVDAALRSLDRQIRGFDVILGGFGMGA